MFSKSKHKEQRQEFFILVPDDFAVPFPSAPRHNPVLTISPFGYFANVWRVLRVTATIL